LLGDQQPFADYQKIDAGEKARERGKVRDNLAKRRLPAPFGILTFVRA
jgi:hypothetical protein